MIAMPSKAYYCSLTGWQVEELFSHFTAAESGLVIFSLVLMNVDLENVWTCLADWYRRSSINPVSNVYI